VAELAERELRVVLDMKMQIDQAGDDRATRQIEDLRVRRQRQRRADLRDAVSLDYDTPCSIGAAPVPSITRTLSSTSART
jgi:hypothetical protein